MNVTPDKKEIPRGLNGRKVGKFVPRATTSSKKKNRALRRTRKKNAKSIA